MYFISSIDSLPGSNVGKGGCFLSAEVQLAGNNLNRLKEHSSPESVPAVSFKTPCPVATPAGVAEPASEAGVTLGLLLPALLDIRQPSTGSTCKQQCQIVMATIKSRCFRKCVMHNHHAFDIH
jgi:hypothetical protein